MKGSSRYDSGRAVRSGQSDDCGGRGNTYHWCLLLGGNALYTDAIAQGFQTTALMKAVRSFGGNSNSICRNHSSRLRHASPYDEDIHRRDWIVWGNTRSSYFTVDRSLSCDVWICRLLFTRRTPFTCLASSSARDFCSEDGTTPLN